MRLQIAILRHDLPAVRLVYNTTPKHAPGVPQVLTISQLLIALDSLVPLQSDAWGYEDYVVEVAATADQLQTYECFHFQEIEDVLKDDDEVIIRGLSGVEINERKLGGRMQIARDGSHLFDGIRWGKRWRAGVSAGRPDVSIPPRKRRRILIESDSDEEIRPELEYPPGRELVPFMTAREFYESDNEDEEDDGDYEQPDHDYEEQSSDEESEDIKQEDQSRSVNALSTSPHRIVKRVTFENADSDDEDEMDEDSDEDLSEGAEDFTAELKALTDDAGTTKVDPEQPRATRRARTVSEDANSSQVTAAFEGFSSPPSRSQVNGVDNVYSIVSNSIDSTFQAAQDHIAASKSIDNDETAATATTGTVLETQSHVGENEGQGTVRSTSNKDNKSQEPAVSSSVEESSDEESNDTSSSEDSGGESSSDEADSSADEGSNSSESTSSSDSSVDSTQVPTQPAAFASSKQENEAPLTMQSSNGSTILPHASNPPGTGQNKTKRNNERKKLSKLLSNLKETGILDKDADFKVLREYLAQTNAEGEIQDEIHAHEAIPSTQERVTARAEEIMARLNGSDTSPSFSNTVQQQVTGISPAALNHQEMNGESALPSSQGTKIVLIPDQNHKDQTANDNVTLRPLSEQIVAGTSKPAQPEPTASSTAHTSVTTIQKPDPSPMESTEISPKRARLDVAASRRMLFNSLGVRNPKTADAENALREKLAKPVRQVKSKDAGPSEAPKPKQTLAADRWKKKFTVLAVECVQDWKKVDTPPFPFKQPWQVRQERDERNETTQQQQRYDDSLNYDEVEEDQDTQPMDIDERTARDNLQSVNTSRTLTAGAADEATNEATDEEVPFPEPSDFSALPALTRADLLRDPPVIHIAYKELRINARSEPEISNYRVARIISSEPDNSVILKLAPIYRESTNEDHDADGEMEESDQGLREMEFDDLINPRRIETTLPGGNSDKNVSTPRRAEITEIMREAGFESAVGDQLLQGLLESAAHEKPLLNGVVPMENHDNTQTTAQRSSPIRPASITPPSVAGEVSRESSMPSESMVESVKYPQLSELGPDTPLPAQSSSHQDAQQTISTPILPPEDTTILTTTLPEPADAPEADSLPSEVPQTQSQDVIPDSHHANQEDVVHNDQAYTLPDIIASEASLEGEKHSTRHSGLHTDEDNDNSIDTDNDPGDSSSIDSNGFPSLRSITSSQPRKGPLRASASAPTTRSKIHPPSPTFSPAFIPDPTAVPTRRSPRVHRSTARTSDWSDTDNPSQSQPQSHFKASQSQPMRLSEVPEDTTVVDLTQSSPATSPDKGEGRAKDKESSAGGGPPLGVSERKRGGGPPSDAFRNVLKGLGEKSYLKKKKRST